MKMDDCAFHLRAAATITSLAFDVKHLLAQSARTWQTEDPVSS